MINGKTVLAIIPARGASKGVHKKNIRKLAGKPLIAWTIEEAKQSKYIDRLILSSEDHEIIKVAKGYGCEVPFVRPKELSLDETPGVQPVLHAISQFETYDYVVLLQPTSPLRKVSDIDGCIEKCEKGATQSCVTLMETDKTPYWMFRMNEEGQLEPLLKDKEVTRRQDAPKSYSLNGAVYVAKRDYLLKHQSFVTKETLGYVMTKERSYDIDTELDFKFCEFLMNNIEQQK
ncbi:MAG TPA: acylneuraminate cytidylyltransferase family protein [Bacillales bacterium]|nr:acylneuraminate cytidylyltransferase family protein [Bacillales bacterium]